MDDDIEIFYRHGNPDGIADIADVIAHAMVLDRLRHVVLFEVIARKGDDAARIITLQHFFDKIFAERAGVTSNQSRLVVKPSEPRVFANFRLYFGMMKEALIRAAIKKAAMVAASAPIIP